LDLYVGFDCIAPEANNRNTSACEELFFVHQELPWQLLKRGRLDVQAETNLFVRTQIFIPRLESPPEATTKNDGKQKTAGPLEINTHRREIPNLVENRAQGTSVFTDRVKIKVEVNWGRIGFCFVLKCRAKSLTVLLQAQFQADVHRRCFLIRSKLQQRRYWLDFL
jgi:hypothetical protein